MWEAGSRTYAAFGLMALLALAAIMVAGASEAAGALLGLFAGVAFAGWVARLASRWERGPELSVEHGTLTFGSRRVAVTDLDVTISRFVADVRTRYVSGTFWYPLMTARFPDGEELRIGCRNAGGAAEEHTASERPQYLLDAVEWNQLAALAAAPGYDG